MKRITLSILAGLFTALLIYLAFAFGNTSLDISTWGNESLFMAPLCMFFGLAITFVACMAFLTE